MCIRDRIVHIANRAELDGIVDGVNDTAERLVASFWPGPLTIVFSSKDCVSKLVTCGKSTVAVRQPSHPVAKALIEAAQVRGCPSPARTADSQQEEEHSRAAAAAVRGAAELACRPFEPVTGTQALQQDALEREPL